ncbi:Asp23/Gls24 family envelope stress response protein [Pseudonocardia sp. DSM 110487]|uniref:Asp23/Gls24 family envelope stress response protein n=1 Tax=Pseudonocardia sp. DSM 110487 TaxID=2865833 RepID=UPI001C6A45E0|nr:Asp23/Gls24 family envelope stress response protein [Pseudonocardia sp. DSM 110487]QYN34527.1 Asp23/Gls24 family envelope stress response protein [Pseudonocardia sp. DSM 110487]
MRAAGPGVTSADPAGRTSVHPGGVVVAPTVPDHRPAPAAERGRTTVGHRVIESVAARIAGEEPGVGGAARRVLGVAVTGEDAEQAPRVEVTVAGEMVSLRIRLSVTYPDPVHEVTGRVRRRLVERVWELTGKRVGMVDVVVVALHRPAGPRRVVR